jgi:predicted secreted protein
VTGGSSDAVVIPIVHGSVLVGGYVIFWFLALFCLLPVGLGEVDTETGAPLSPMLLRKAAIATVIAAVLWVAFYALIAFGVLDL